ncbi:MAG: hypothetical protein HYY31_07015 [Chloroflexi bacterium]|nr:hypothetical protein [Chloroflexota bacterium]
MFAGLVLVFVGVVLLLERLDIISNGFSTYWPVILIVLGLSFLFNRLSRRWW